MKQLEEIGICPQCECSLFVYKTNNYKRFVKCEICGYSFALPKKGKISNSNMICEKKNLFLLIVSRPKQKSYFWTDSPCFSCSQQDSCKPLNALRQEFKENQVYGY